jgi:hypothetical protein
MQSEKIWYTLWLGNDQEIEFQEIEIGIFQEIKSFAKLIRRSKLAFLNFLQN